MNHTPRSAPRIAAPRVTRILAEILALGVLAQAMFAGGFLGGHHQWLAWHQHLGDLIVIIPVAILAVGLVRRRRHFEAASVLATRFLLVIFVVGAEATGHAAGSLLAIHIPLAVAAIALVAWLGTRCVDARSEIGGRLSRGQART